MSQSSGYALRFISGKYQGGEFPLADNTEVIIGRSSELDMVLVEDMVSRKHAKIITREGEIYIMDLGSTNGTFINGERIKKARVNEGDRILIGTSIVKVIASNDAALDSARGMPQLAESDSAKSSTMSGSIREVPLPDLLQLFSTSKKSGVLDIRGANEGQIFLRKGRVYYALVDGNHDLGPQKALFRMIAWDDGDFALNSPSEDEVPFELDESTEGLIMEAMRQTDELARIRDRCPGVGDTLTAAEPLLPLLSELKAPQLDIFQIAFNFGLVQDVLDHAPGTDYQTFRVLADLIDNDYLRAL